jgi:hypothetical protein
VSAPVSPQLATIVANVRIQTGDPRRPVATAIGIQDGKVAVIGVAAEILKLARADTRVIDGHGQTLSLPGGAAVGSNISVHIDPTGRITVLTENDPS